MNNTATYLVGERPGGRELGEQVQQKALKLLNIGGKIASK
jgi:hypothetical protein